MHYVIGVSVFERGTDLAREINHLLKIVRWRLAQVGTFHQLHDKERKAVVLADVVHGDNVGMIQGRSRTRLTHETRALLGAGSFFRGTTMFTNIAPFPFTRSPFPLFPL